MAKLLPLIPAIVANCAYSRLRYLLAGIARCLRFMEKELVEVMNGTPCVTMAHRAAEKYFYLSRTSAVYGDMVIMFQALFTVAPVLQRLKGSMGFDWHHGHVLTWFRTNTAMNIGRWYFGCQELSRVPDPVVLRENLHHLRIYDGKFADTLEMLMRCYYGRNSVTGKLAACLFDPIMFCRLGDHHTLRVGNKLYRLERQGFPGCVDLRTESAIVLGYSLRRKDWLERFPLSEKLNAQKGKAKRRQQVRVIRRGMLEIAISGELIDAFKAKAVAIINCSASIEYRIHELDSLMVSFLASVRYARTGFDQVLHLSRWLANNMKPLHAAVDRRKKFNRRKPPVQVPPFHKILLSRFQSNLDTRRYYPRPNFFYDPQEHPEELFLQFFSPYREEV
jgi:hypothetical protein